LTPPHRGEVRDHLALELVVTQRAQELACLLEVLDRRRHAAVGVDERKREVVECQGLGAPIAELACDRQRRSVVVGRAFVVLLAPKLNSARVQPSGSATRIVGGLAAA